MSRLFANNGRLDTTIALPAGSFWMAGWVKRSAAGTDTIFGFFAPGTADGFYIQLSSGGVAQAVASASGSATASSATLAIADTTIWHHVVGAFVGPTSFTSKVWMDGANSGSQPSPRSPTGVTTARIGARGDAASFMSGRIAHAIAGTGFPTDAEVLQMFSNPPPSIRTTTQFFYAPLVENRSPEIDDIDGLELTITNATFDTDNPPIGPPVIASVGTVQQGASLTITGIGFEPASTNATVTIDGVAQTVNTGTDTSLTINAVSVPRYGQLIVAVTNSLGLTDSLSVPVIPAAGLGYVDLTTPTSADQRVTTTPDLQTGWQLEYESTDLQILEDGSFIADDTLPEFDFRVNDGTGYGAVATQVLEDPSTPPVLSAVLLPVITYVNAATQISVADGATGWTTITEVGTSLTTLGLTLSTEGIITGSPIVSGVYSITIRYANLDGAINSAPFLLTVIGIPVTSGIPPNLVYNTNSGIQVIDFKPYFTDATDYTIDPPVPEEWDFSEGILTIDPRVTGLTGPYVVTGANPAGTASLPAFSIFIETVNQIVFQTPSHRINERSSAIVVARFRGQATNADITPTNVMYRLDSDTGEVLNWTALSAAASSAIIITSAQTATQGKSQNLTLSVAADYGLPTQFIDSTTFQIKNQPYSN